MGATTTTGKIFIVKKYIFYFMWLLYVKNRCEAVKAGMLEMPYKGGDMSMIFILPFEKTPLSQVEEALKDFSWTEFYEKANMVSRQ